MSLKAQKAVEEETRPTVSEVRQTVAHVPEVIDLPAPERGKAIQWKEAA
jgi:hypothetical protein